ncbi:MAG: hypothetical protein KAT91_01000 [Candidatus Aenigmarchaeota archaeon]|nr:hypothetical protein [Candidatus Aenigmarchaeota archaeon]
MIDFSLMLSNLESMGFYTFVLPWVLFLVIIYSIVTKAPFLKGIGGQAKQISVIIAAILSFFIVNYEWQGRFVGDYMTELFGSMSLYMAGFLVLILFLGMGGWGLNSIFGGKWIPIVLVLVAIMLFFNTGAAAEFNIDEETSTWLFMLFLVGGALWFLQQEPKETPKEEVRKHNTPESETPQKQPKEPTEDEKKKAAEQHQKKLAELQKKVDEKAAKDPEFKKAIESAKPEEVANVLKKYGFDLSDFK